MEIRNMSLREVGSGEIFTSFDLSATLRVFTVHAYKYIAVPMVKKDSQGIRFYLHFWLYDLTM